MVFSQYSLSDLKFGQLDQKFRGKKKNSIFNCKARTAGQGAHYIPGIYTILPSSIIIENVGKKNSKINLVIFLLLPFLLSIIMSSFKVLRSVLDTLSLLVGETHEYTHNTMSAMSPRSQTMTLYATVLGSALTTTLLLTSTFGRPSSKSKENNDDLTLHDLIPKRVRGKAEGGNVVIPSSTRTSALDREIHSLDTSSSPSSLSSLLRSTELMEKKKKKNSIIHASGSNTTTAGGDDNDDDYTDLSSVVETSTSTEDEVVFEETGTLGTYYIVGETRPTPKQQLENLLDTMTSSSRGTTTVDTRPCPPSFRKREQSNGEEGERNQDSSEDDYRLLSNKAYYPTAMAKASNSVTKKWSSVSSSSRSSRSNAEYEKSSSLVMPSTHTDRLRHHHVPRGSVTPLGDSSTTTTMLGRQPRVTRSVGKNFPPRRSQLQQHANPLPSPSMNRMRTRDQHLSYGGNPQQTTRAATTTTKRGSSTSSSNNNTSSSSMAATPSSLHMSTTTSTWSATPSPSLPLGAMSSRPSPSPAAPSPRSGRSTLRPIGRTGSILGVSRVSNGTSSVSAPRASVSLTAQKQQKLLSLSRGVSIKQQQQQQQQQTTSSSTEVRRIKFQMPDSPQHVANDENVVHREISTPPKQDRNNYSSPMKMSVPATSMSPSPPQQSRAVSRTLSYTPAKLPSTTNNIVV